MTSYTLTMTAFLLLGGSLGDRLGRRKVYLIGIVWFALASAAIGCPDTASEDGRARALPRRPV
jgi:MFS family permease